MGTRIQGYRRVAPQPLAGLWNAFSALVVHPAGGNTWVLVDEHPDSINDGFFCVDMIGYPNPASTTLPDCPASYHNRACGFAFADGHSEIHKWLDSRTTPPISNTHQTYSPPANQGSNQDIIWLWQHTTSLK